MTTEEKRSLASESRSTGIPIVAASAVRSGKQRWLWKYRIPHPAITLLAGRGGTGKSTMCAAIAAHVTGGPVLFDHLDCPRIRGAVLWATAEENTRATVVPRLRSAQAKTGKVYFPGLDVHGQVQHSLEFPADLHHIRDMAVDLGVRLVILDPLASFCPSVDVNNMQQVRELMKGFRLVGEQCDLSWLLIAHPNKSRTGPILDRIFASAAIHQCSRSVLLCGLHPSGDKTRVLVHAKTNDGTEAQTLRFGITPNINTKLPPFIGWKGYCDVSAEMLGIEALDAGEMDQHTDARTLLKKFLTIEQPAKDVLAEGLATGISERSLRSAKAELCVTSRRVDDGLARAYWVWCPPEGGFKE